MYDALNDNETIGYKQGRITQLKAMHEGQECPKGGVYDLMFLAEIAMIEAEIASKLFLEASAKQRAFEREQDLKAMKAREMGAAA